MIPVHERDPMPFECCSENPCFNECCRDLNQALTPYDILRLKRNLGISSQVFLKKYTSFHFGPGSGLPIVAFKLDPATGYECPFVTPKGCSVYADRPGSCRLYPLARAIAMDRETKEINEYFALIEEPHCKGFGKKTNLTVREWMDGQEVTLHNLHNDKLMELISLKNRILPGNLDGAQSDQVYLALYNLDEFRYRIFERGILKDFNLADSRLQTLKTDDETLMDFGIAWVKNMLFGIGLDIKE